MVKNSLGQGVKFVASQCFSNQGRWTIYLVMELDNAIILHSRSNVSVVLCEYSKSCKPKLFMALENEN